MKSRCRIQGSRCTYTGVKGSGDLPRCHAFRSEGHCVQTVEDIRSYDIYTISPSDHVSTLPGLTPLPTPVATPRVTPRTSPEFVKKTYEWFGQVRKRKHQNDDDDSGVKRCSVFRRHEGAAKRGDVRSEKEAEFEHSRFWESDDSDTSTVVSDDGASSPDTESEVLPNFESWVDLSKADQNGETPDRVTPLPFGNGEEYLRLLREAQKDSNQSSAKVSLASSRRDTPRDSPKSPPNSPNTELAIGPEDGVPDEKEVYINYYNKQEGEFVQVEKNTETDWIWDWSSRPDQTPPKDWHFVHPSKAQRRGASIRRVKVGNSSLFSRDVLYTLIITNVISVLLGTGLGIWLCKRSGNIIFEGKPIN